MQIDTSLILVKPEEKYLFSYLAVCQNSYHAVHNPYLLHDPEKFDEWKNTIFKRYDMDEKGMDLPENYLPSVTFWGLYGGGEVAAVVNIRLGLNRALADYGGHAGFMLSVPYRNRKLSPVLVRLTIEKARERKISPVLMTCTDENTASLCALKKVPALKVEKAVTWADGKYCAIHRFWY